MTPSPLTDPTSPRLIILTRPAGTDPSMRLELEQAGWQVEEAPLTVLMLRDYQLWALQDAMDWAAQRTDSWLILPSPAAVRGFAQWLSENRIAWSNNLRLATVGEGSRQSAAQYGLEVDFTPPEATGQSLGETLPAKEGGRVLIVGSAQSRPELREALTARGLTVRQVALYEPAPNPAGVARLAQLLAKHPAAAVLLTSPSALNALDSDPQFDPQCLSQARCVAIGPTTAQHLLQKNWTCQALLTAPQPTAQGIMQALGQAG